MMSAWARGRSVPRRDLMRPRGLEWTAGYYVSGHLHVLPIPRRRQQRAPPLAGSLPEERINLVATPALTGRPRDPSPPRQWFSLSCFFFLVNMSFIRRELRSCSTSLTIHKGYCLNQTAELIHVTFYYALLCTFSGVIYSLR
jgi:hypothetical protein